MSVPCAPPPPPELPERIEPERLREMDGAALEAQEEELRRAERTTRAAMVPYDRVLR